MKTRSCILDRFLERFLIDFGVGLGVILDSKIDQKTMSKFDRFLDASWEGSGGACARNHAINSRVSEDWGSPGEGRVRVEPSTQDPGH